MTVKMTATPAMEAPITIRTVTAVWLMDDEPVDDGELVAEAAAAVPGTELVTTTWLTEGEVVAGASVVAAAAAV